MSTCPSLQDLEKFLDGQQSDRLAEHIDHCAVCQAALEQLTASASVSSASAVMSSSSQSHARFFARLKQHPPRPGQRADVFHDQDTLPNIAGYEILAELGRGGMGVVYKARHVGLDRLVALKTILAGPHAGPKEQTRFRQEAEAVARLQHANIIQIYDIGEADGRSFLALEFVEGVSLAQVLRGAPQPHLPAARLVETLAGAIHYAHQQGIVHRDLKPANILLQRSEVRGQRSEVGSQRLDFSDLCPLTSDLWPKITDFGLAKRLDHEAGAGQSSEIVGTPSYMAPEQAARPGRTVGPAADVYALGAILYELLTGRPPFRGPTPLDTVLQVLHEDPVRPSHFRRDLPRDLETICLKCLAKEPGRRYASAAALAEDLARFRKGQPIHARPVGPAEMVWKWARRRPLSAALAAGLILAAVSAYLTITWLWREASLARDDIEIQREKAEAARGNEAEHRKQARIALYFSRVAQSQLQWRLNDFHGAEQSLVKCIPAADEVDERGWEWRYLHGLFHNDLFTLPHGHAGQGGSVSYDRQGGRIATVVSGPPLGETPLPSEVRLWDARSGGLTQTWSGPSTLHRVTFHPDGKRLGLATTDGAVLLWDADTGAELLRRTLHQGTVWALAFSPDGRTAASAGADGALKIWDCTTGKVLHDISAHAQAIHSVAFHPQQPMLATGSSDTTVKLWDAATGKELQVLRGHKVGVVCVAFSPDGESLVSASGSGNLKTWDLQAGRTIQSLTGETGGVLHVAYSPDGRYLAKAGKDGSVRIWHLTTGVERMAFRGHTMPVECVHFSPDGQRVVSISPGDGVAKVWDLTRHPEHATFARTDKDLEAIGFADEGQRLLSVTVSGKLQRWDAATGMLLAEHLLPTHRTLRSPAVPLTFARDGRSVAAPAEPDARVVLRWRTEDGAEAASYRGHTLPVCCARFSPDGHLLATAASGPDITDAPHEIKIWDAATGAVVAERTGKGRLFNLAFAPDQHLLAWSGQDGVVMLWPWETSSAITLPAHHSDVTGLAFSADGKRLASAGMEDRRVKIWNTADLLIGGVKELHTLAAPALICDLAFSPDQRRLAAISRDMVKLWDVETGHEALTLRGAAQRYWDPAFNPRLAFSPDGTLLAGTNWDESISLWEAPLLDRDEDLAKFQDRRRRFADQRTRFWHLQEAELCLVHRNVKAAQFHLKFLQEDFVTGPLQMRKERLQQTLKQWSK
jgi:WD40 repeat protein/serine/threonine protein kinase